MTSCKTLKLFVIYLGLLVLCLYTTPTVMSQGVTPLDTMDIFYDLTNNGSKADCEGPMPLGEFVKRTLVGEIGEAELNQWDEDAIKANAIAVRTFTISSYKSDEYVHTDGQSYHCTNAWEQGFEANEETNLSLLQTQYPTLFQAVDDTEGMILTHPEAINREINIEQWPVQMRFGAIEASYKRETGIYTLGISGRPWLKSVYDPISQGTAQSGMGQLGTKRWAWGRNDADQEFPKWDYRRILAHYYSEVEFDGAITPNPPEALRAASLPINYFITAERGKPTSVIIMNDCD